MARARSPISPPPFEEKEMFGAREENFHIFFSDGSVRRELERILNHSDAWRSTGYLVKGYLEEREQREEGYRGGGEAGKGCQPGQKEGVLLAVTGRRTRNLT